MFLSILVAAAAMSSGPMPERGTLHGETAIEPFGTRGVAIYVDTNRDGSLDHAFLLQVERHEPIEADVKRDRETGGPGEPAVDRPMSMPAPEPAYFKEATIEFAPGYVRVWAGNDAMELFVEGSQSAAWNPGGARMWRRAGYGLVHEIHESTIAIRRQGRESSITAEYCDASSGCNPDDAGGSGGGGGGGGSGTTLCDAGGPGSVSCSVSANGSSCTSSCGTGYYACCMYGTPARCRCIRGG